MACDEGVVRRTQSPRAYAECLTSLAERRLELRLERRRAQALSLGAFGRRPELVRRVYSILARKQALRPMAARALVGVAGCGLLVASVELAGCPQMVAFVPAAQTAKLETQAMRNDSSLRVVETKAVFPAAHDVAVLTPTRLHRAVKKSIEPADALQPQIATNADAPREVLLRADMPDADAGNVGQDANSAFAGVPRYIELTTWEEVRTSQHHVRQFADYDTSAPAPPQSADSANPTRRGTFTRITVTRLILAIYPISFRSNGAGINGSEPGTKPAQAEDSGQATAPLPESDWLVFQL
jgi:hypothetical protein